MAKICLRNYSDDVLCVRCGKPWVLNQICEATYTEKPKNSELNASWLEGYEQRKQEEQTQKVLENKPEMVNHPAYYGGDSVYEAIKVIEAWNLGFSLGNVVKYISRAGKKGSASELQDLQKAARYLNFAVEKLKRDS